LKWSYGYPRRFRPVGDYRATSIDTARPPSARATPGDKRDQARTEELNKLRLALSTFALQLELFEMRMRKRQFEAGAEAAIPTPSSDTGARLPNEK
jgi:hypothetical protein